MAFLMYFLFETIRSRPSIAISPPVTSQRAPGSAIVEVVVVEMIPLELKSSTVTVMLDPDGMFEVTSFVLMMSHPVPTF
jgi:hypothetical protein